MLLLQSGIQIDVVIGPDGDLRACITNTNSMFSYDNGGSGTITSLVPCASLPYLDLALDLVAYTTKGGLRPKSKFCSRVLVLKAKVILVVLNCGARQISCI